MRDYGHYSHNWDLTPGGWNGYPARIGRESDQGKENSSLGRGLGGFGVFSLSLFRNLSTPVTLGLSLIH